MSDTPYSPLKPPKTITQIKDDDFLDFASKFTQVLIFFIGVSFGLIMYLGIIQNNICKLATFLLLIVWIYIWIKYFSSPSNVEKWFMVLGFRYKDLSGKHVINKFDVPDTFLQKLVPIVNIHVGGIIEFTEKKWGVLMETHPIRISDEEREEHEKKMERVVNGIPANTHFKTIACSRLEPRKPIMQYLLDVSNKSTGKKATDQHLAGLYNKVASDNTPVISWKYYAFQSLGEQSSFEAAKIQYGAVIPGLLKNMKGAGLQPSIYEDPNEIAYAYRTMFSEMVV